jgi:hypothetical protein
MDFSDKYFQDRKAGEVLRLRQTDLDFQWITQKVNVTSSEMKKVVFDFGCSDGYLLSKFNPTYFDAHGLEINASMELLAKSKGIKMHSSLIEMNEIDIFILRGVLHHLPEYSKTFEDLLSIFSNSHRKSIQIFLLANPNAASFLWKRFQRLPMVERDDHFKSVFKVHDAQELRGYFLSKGAEVEIAYPYLNTPYRSLRKDMINFLYSLSTNTYRDFAWPKNIFNMHITLIKK